MTPSKLRPSRARSPGAAAWLAVVLLLCGFAPKAPADDERPRIGLVLSGGGARGAAHIGVLRELQRQRIPVDVIAGTSMGAIVGGLYASGLAVDEIEDALRSIDWSDIFDDNTDRRRLSVRRKRDDDLFLLDKEAGLRDGELAITPGIIKGQKLYLELTRLTLHVSSVDDFDRLAIPFRCVATDIASGEAVVLGEGDLATAIRASMAVPAIFSPVERNGIILVDGGISDNLPVDVARRMGADIIIASDISSPLLTAAELGSVVSIASQLTALLTRRNIETQIAALGPGDVLLTPDLGGFSAADFGNAMDVIEAGAIATRGSAAALRGLALSPRDYAAHRQSMRRVEPASPANLSFVRIDNDAAVDDDVILARLGIQTGAPLDLERLEAGIADVYALDMFDSVTYHVVHETQDTGLVVVAREKPWGPDFLQFGLRFETDFGKDGGTTLGLSHIRLPWGTRGGEWRTALLLGETRGVLTELYRPFAQGSPLFGYASLYYADDFFAVTDDDRQVAENRVRRVGLNLALGRELGAWGETRFGYARYAGEVDTVVGGPTGENDDLDGGQLFARFLTDTLDDAGFPRSGLAAGLRYGYAHPDLGADQAFQQLGTRVTGARSFGPHTLRAGLDLLATWDGDAPLPDQGRLGGLFRLPGMANRQLVGDNLLLLDGGYMHALGRVSSMPTFAGLNLQLGNVFADTDDFDVDRLRWGLGAWLGLDSPAGPVYVGYGIGENANRSLYFLLGGQF